MDKMSVTYLCDGTVPLCRKSNCYMNGGDCMRTGDVRYAVNFESVGGDGCYYELSEDERRHDDGN